MDLCRVTLENYRAFQKADWILPPSGLILVAGANNSGKSSLLSALDVIAGTVESGPGLAYRNARSSSNPVVTATFRMSDEARARTLGRIHGIEDDGTAFRDVQFIFEMTTEGGFAASEIRASWPHSPAPVCVARVNSETSHQYELRAIAPDQSGTPLGEISLSSRMQGGINPVLESHQYSVAELIPIWDELNAWRSHFFHFKALRGGSPRSVNLASEPRLDPSGSNLPAVLLDLQTNRSRLMDDLRSIISQMVPDVGRLETPTLNNRLEVAFSDPFNSGFKHNLKELGTGVEQLLLTLVVGLTEEPSSTLVVEEPETNLHPAAQRALLGLLNSWASDRLIIAATHSPVMLDWTPGGNQLWQVSRIEGASHLEVIDEMPLELLRSLGVRISDVLSADRILVVEGPSDIDVLGTWFPEVMRNPRISVISGGGGDNARFADLFTEWLTNIERLGLRRVLYLRDRDELSPDDAERLARSGNVHVLDCREIENYLLDPKAITSVLARQPQLKMEVTSRSVEEVIRQSVESLKPSMVVNRVARRMQNVRLMDHVMRGQLAKQGASQEEFWRSIEARLPDPESIRSSIGEFWEEASGEVSEMGDDQLVKWAPGEEVLNAVYLHFLGRRFKKRSDGGELASAIESPPSDLVKALERFMSDTK